MIEDWVKTREGYISWVANTELRLWLENEVGFRWNGMSLWWALNPTQKDNVHSYEWYSKLHEVLKEQKTSDINFTQMNRFQLFIGLSIPIIHLIKRLVLKFLLFLFTKTKSLDKNTYIWFHSLIYNLVDLNGEVVDRLFNQSPDLAVDYDHNIAYVIKYFTIGKFNINIFF